MNLAHSPPALSHLHITTSKWVPVQRAGPSACSAHCALYKVAIQTPNQTSREAVQDPEQSQRARPKEDKGGCFLPQTFASYRHMDAESGGRPAAAAS